MAADACAQVRGIAEELGLGLADIPPLLLAACPRNVHLSRFGVPEPRAFAVPTAEYRALCALYVGPYPEVLASVDDDEDDEEEDEEEEEEEEEEKEHPVGHTDGRGQVGQHGRLTDLYRFQARCFPLNARLLHPFSLSAQPCRSVYRRHARAVEPASPACGADSVPARDCGPNQCDLSLVTADTEPTGVRGPALAVALSPAERARRPAHTLPFFRALRAAHLGVVVDLASRYAPGPFADTADYLDAAARRRLPFVRVVAEHAVPGSSSSNGGTGGGDWWRIAVFEGHVFVHYKIADWADARAPTVVAALRANAELDRAVRAASARAGPAVAPADAARVCVHCNGGLGRAPTFVCLRAVWCAAQRAAARSIPRVCRWHHQDRLVVGSGDGSGVPALNLAAVVRAVLVRGYYTRSFFVQTADQCALLQPFADAVAAHTFT